MAAAKFTAIQAAEGIACGISADDKRQLKCWKPNYTDGPKILKWSFEFTDLTLKGQTVCGTLKAALTVVCWTLKFDKKLYDVFQDTPIQPRDSYYNKELFGPQSYLQVAISEKTACGIRSEDRKVRCFDLADGQEDAPRKERDLDLDAIRPTIPFGQIAAGKNHFCGIRFKDAKLYCWTYDGDCGRDCATTKLDRRLRGLTFTDISASDDYTCGIRKDNQKIECWGARTTDDLKFLLSEKFLEISTSGTMVCGIVRVSGMISCTDFQAKKRTTPEKFEHIPFGVRPKSSVETSVAAGSPGTNHPTVVLTAVFVAGFSLTFVFNRVLESRRRLSSLEMTFIENDSSTLF